MRICSDWPDRRRAGALALALWLTPQAVAAHAPVPGIEGFYTGLLHPLTTQGQLLALLALGAMLGLTWQPRRIIVSWAGFAASVLLGILLGQSGLAIGSEDLALLGIAVLAATAGALLPSGLTPLCVLLCSAGGLLIGMVSTTEPGPVRDVIMTVSGSFVGANMGLIYTAGLVGWLRERFPQHWVGIGLRIAAAWTAAIAILMASLSLATLQAAG